MRARYSRETAGSRSESFGGRRAAAGTGLVGAAGPAGIHGPEICGDHVSMNLVIEDDLNEFLSKK